MKIVGLNSDIKSSHIKGTQTVTLARHLIYFFILSAVLFAYQAKYMLI